MEQKIEILIDSDKCTGCGSCAGDCRRNALKIENEKAVVIKSDCLKCGHCLAICPANAVKLNGYDDEIIDMPKKNVFLNERDLMTHLKFRRSIREYKNIPVEKEKLDKIIEAGRISPTASNSQNVRYIVLQNDVEAIEDEGFAMYKTQRELSETISNYMKIPVETLYKKLKRGFLFHKAPVVILVISPSDINACLAAMNMELMAETLGLGVVYVGLFTRPANKNKSFRESLGITEDENIAVCMALGYPNVQYLRSVPRKQANVIWK